jgi:NTP pyrophosphatase (non-canonical NTP hydrolase)
MKLTNEESKVFKKLIEELTELSLELIHALNKVKKENTKEILEEISDVKKYINLLENLINERV